MLAIYSISYSYVLVECDLVGRQNDNIYIFGDLSFIDEYKCVEVTT